MQNRFRHHVAIIGCLLTAGFASAYVDLAPTLARIVNEATFITVAEVVGFSPEQGAVILKKVRDLKGTSGDEPIKHRLLRADESTVDLPLVEWAEPGRRCVLFVTGKAAVVCVGEGWYQAHAGEDGWWRIGAPRPDLPLAFYGSVSRLTNALPLILAGKTAVITTLPHGVNREGASFDLALNRASLPGMVKVQRLRASTRMPAMAMGVGSNPAYFIGMGRVGEADMMELSAQLKSADAVVRAEVATELGYSEFAVLHKEGQRELETLLDDENPRARLAAAAALLRSGRRGPFILKITTRVLSEGIADKDATVRRQAARAVGLAGSAAAPLTVKLAPLLGDPDTLVRRTALRAIATLGPEAAEARAAVTALLERPETAIDAADALGRMGPAARPSMQALARLLSAEAPAMRWAAVRAMAQIGGPDAGPVVKFIRAELPKASEADGYNMLIYLSLLGPVAKDALPAVRSSRVRNPILRQATAWAIEPSADFPEFGPVADLEFAHYILEAYVRELGEHLKPAAKSLAERIMAGKAPSVPPWGYKLLARFPEQSLAILTPALADRSLVMRERATVALGYMGRPAQAARPQVALALQASQDEREQRLLQWCLRELD